MTSKLIKEEQLLFNEGMRLIESGREKVLVKVKESSYKEIKTSYCWFTLHFR